MSILSALRARVPAKAYTLAKAGAAMAVVGWGLAVLQQVLEDQSAQLDDIYDQIERGEKRLEELAREQAEFFLAQVPMDPPASSAGCGGAEDRPEPVGTLAQLLNSPPTDE